MEKFLEYYKFFNKLNYEDIGFFRYYSISNINYFRLISYFYLKKGKVTFNQRRSVLLLLSKIKDLKMRLFFIVELYFFFKKFWLNELVKFFFFKIGVGWSEKKVKRLNFEVLNFINFLNRENEFLSFKVKEEVKYRPLFFFNKFYFDKNSKEFLLNFLTFRKKKLEMFGINKGRSLERNIKVKNIKFLRKGGMNLLIKRTSSNWFCILYNKFGNVIWELTGGQLLGNVRKRAKLDWRVPGWLFNYGAKFILEDMKIKSLNIYMVGFNIYAFRRLVNTLRWNRFFIVTFFKNYKLPHNKGLRRKKVRRL